jgi:DNA mismatch repair ATPase MutS
MKNIEDIREKYVIAVKSFRNLAGREDKILMILSGLRLISFLGGIFLAWYGYTRNLFSGTIILSSAIAIFLFLLKRFSLHTSRKEMLNNLTIINLNEAEAVSGNFSKFENGHSFINTGHDFTNDVDLFGESSVYQYLNRTSTGYGRDILATWLSNPFSLSARLESRQKAIKEVAGKVNWRQEFMAIGMNKNLNRDEISGLTEWIKELPYIDSSPVKKFLIGFLPVVILVSFILTASGLIHYTILSTLFLANLIFIFTGLKKTNEIHRVLTGKYNYLSSLVTLFRIFEEEPFESEVFSGMKMNTNDNSISAVKSLKKLSRLVQSFDSRMNFLVGIILNGFLLWDYHCIHKLEKWKSKYRDHFPVWLEMLGQVDAYISLANYAYNNPDFIFPEISKEGTLFSSKQLGHQLIRRTNRVCNDFKLEQQGNICIITGANMSGKSTFLRTIAINFILAMTGAPVCAEEMTFTPVRLFTSMRTSDSLSSNESYFIQN